MRDLEGKRVLITGASGGIGGAIASQFHGAGAVVTLSGTRLKPLDSLKAKLGDRAFTVRCNLENNSEISQLVNQATELMGGVDILVNNAGLTRDNLFMRMSDEDWDRVIAVNLSATFKLCRSAVRGMMKSRWGRIINISSVVGVIGNPGQANYVASKAGIIGMSKSLAYEVASRGITVNCIAPGFINTRMTEKLSDQQKNSIIAQIPIGRMGTVDEIASGVLYLASTGGSYLTGTVLHINGGMAML